MEISEISRFMISGILKELSGDVDKDIATCRRYYQDMESDLLCDAVKNLEQILFRLYQIKYYVQAVKSDVDVLAFVTDDGVRNTVMEEILARLDADAGKRYYEEAVEYIRKKDYITAGGLFRQSALLGDAGGQYNYGVTVSAGEGCPADPLEGAFWYRIAAHNGNERAMLNLGVAYRKGEGVKQNGRRMMYWYAVAANTLRTPEAVYYLGLSLKNSEVLSGNERIGRAMIQASDHLQDDQVREYVKKMTAQIIDLLQKDVLGL